MAFLIMATHKDTTRSTKKSPQIPTDDPSAGFNGTGLCDYRDNQNTNACCIQHTALVERTTFGSLSVDLQKIVRRCAAIMTVLALRGQPWQRRQTHGQSQTPLDCGEHQLDGPTLLGLQQGLCQIVACGPVCAVPPKNCPPSANGTAKCELSLMK